MPRARAHEESARHSTRGDDPRRLADEAFMGQALAEARRGLGRTSPNPAVGAVLVKGGRVIAKGHHSRAGAAHAEVVALRAAGARARGADLYSTLEPCNHHGRTPPCTGAILDAGVRRVIVGCRDANPLVCGRGVDRLEAAGVDVATGVLSAECAALYRAFFTFTTERRPFVTLKVASTADGRIATKCGDSRWITSEESRARVHLLRDRVDAVLVGGETVRRDDPRLTSRKAGREGKRQPLRVVLSASCDLSPDARIFAPPGRALVFTASRDAGRVRALESRGVEVLEAPAKRGRIDLLEVLRILAARDVVHLLVEGGANVFGQFLAQGLADEAMVFVAPKILGDGLSWGAFAAPSRIAEAIALSDVTVERVGVDVLMTGRPSRE
jgi:diaminohydroxyphosphoribosylaminopyrimidine deaminase/5-amino-6-(5-phosphoribosylamino)uracil reductase